jgi:hypothetical protein
MAQLANRHSAASFLTVHEVLCEDGRCSPYVDNVPVYFNPTHLSAKGSYRIGEAIAGTAAHAAWIAAFSSGNRRSQAVAFDGFRPQFKYAIRSQRHEPSGAGQYRHVVIAEYIDAESPDIQTSIKTGLAASGFSVEGPVVDRDSLRYVARNPQMSTLVVVVHAKPALKLISPGAKGVVSFSWKDRQIR